MVSKKTGCRRRNVNKEDFILISSPGWWCLVSSLGPRPLPYHPGNLEDSTPWSNLAKRKIVLGWFWLLERSHDGQHFPLWNDGHQWIQS